MIKNSIFNISCKWDSSSWSRLYFFFYILYKSNITVYGSQLMFSEILRSKIALVINWHFHSFLIWRWWIKKDLFSDVIGLIIKRSHSDNDIVGTVCDQDTSWSLCIRRPFWIICCGAIVSLLCFSNLVVYQDKKYQRKACKGLVILSLIWIVPYESYDMTHMIWIKS